MYRTCKKAVDTFGKDNQTNMATEELAELIVALNHWRRGRAGKDAVIEEIADCYLMLLQLTYIVTGASDFSPVIAEMERKLQRLNRRIEEWQPSASTD
jgi:NTP pyrophosphatase (non-canonical NTP hydrolase)